MDRLIRTYIVCNSAFDFGLKPLFASVDTSKFKNGRVHFGKAGMKGLIESTCDRIITYSNRQVGANRVNPDQTPQNLYSNFETT